MKGWMRKLAHQVFINIKRRHILSGTLGDEISGRKLVYIYKQKVIAFCFTLTDWPLPWKGTW